MRPRPRGRAWRKLCAEIIALAGGRCYYCGATATTVDHRRPIIRGGTESRSNLVAACARCNSAKGSLTEAAYLAKIGLDKPFAGGRENL